MVGDERWLPVVGYEDLYEVSNLGRVRSVDAALRNSATTTCVRRGRILRRQKRGREGYPSVSLSKGARVKCLYVQRLVLEAFRGPCPPRHQACHGPDPDPQNCTLANLRWDTVSSNQKDRLAQGGRDYRGSANGNVKLTEIDVERIFDLRRHGFLLREIGAWIGTSDSNVWLILRCKGWKHAAPAIFKGATS